MSGNEADDKSGAERAARLRAEIEKLTQGEGKPAAEKSGEKPSPRDFIHKRMQELDRKPE